MTTLAVAKLVHRQHMKSSKRLSVIRMPKNHFNTEIILNVFAINASFFLFFFIKHRGVFSRYEKIVQNLPLMAYIIEE